MVDNVTSLHKSGNRICIEVEGRNKQGNPRDRRDRLFLQHLMIRHLIVATVGENREPVGV